MKQIWDSCTPRELRNDKIISFAFLIISILIFISFSKVAGGIMLFLWVISESGPFILGSKGSMKNKIYVLKMVEAGYGDWEDEEIMEQVKVIEECGYKWFEKKGKVGFRHSKTGLYLYIEGLHLYSPEKIKETYDNVWSKDSPNKARERDIFNKITQETMLDGVVSDILSTIGDVERISKIDYAKAIMMGENKIVIYFCKKKNNKVTNERHLNEKKFIITISDNVLIITKKIGKKQIPITVKKWKKVYDNLSSFKHGLNFQHGIEYQDSAGNTWLYLKSSGQELLNMENETGERLTFIFE